MPPYYSSPAGQPGGHNFTNILLYYTAFWAIGQEKDMSALCNLEFYNRDKGRKALNLTEKYKNKRAGNEEKQAQRKESKKNVVSGYWR